MTYVQPLTLLCLLVLSAGLIRSRASGRWLWPAVGVLLLFLLTWPPVDWLFSWPLEASYAVEPHPSEPVQAIVVFASSVTPPRPEHPYPIPDQETHQRCEHAAWLYKNWQPVPILASGGHQRKGDEPLSVIMRRLLVRAGVPDSAILTEENSHSTYENALYSAALLRSRRITSVALVVEASSMPRAAAALRRQGIHVVPAPSAFRGFGPAVDELIPTWKALQRNEATLHEVVGLAWYRLRGWI